MVEEFDRNVICQYAAHPKCPNCYHTRVRKTRKRNDYGFVASVRNLTRGAHEALNLSEEVVESLRLSLQRATTAEIYATNVLNLYVHYDLRPESILQRLDQPDTGSISVCDMENLLRLLYNVFSPSPDQMVFKFEWVYREHSWFGSCGPYNGVTQIRMNSLSCRQPAAYGNLSSGAMGRLGTLLHELVHAFIHKYACNRCSAHYGNVKTAAGHGHVWQRIANWVEHAAQEALKSLVSLARFEAIQFHWENMKPFPNPAEARLWELRDD